LLVEVGPRKVRDLVHELKREQENKLFELKEIAAKKNKILNQHISN